MPRQGDYRLLRARSEISLASDPGSSLQIVGHLALAIVLMPSRTGLSHVSQPTKSTQVGDCTPPDEQAMTQRIPFLDLRGAYDELQQEIDEAVRRVIASGWYIGGPELERFEAEFAAYCQARHCVGAANGLEALELILLALGVGRGDEVIVASNTFIATLLAVSATGACPVLVEPDPATHNLDSTRVEAAITQRTKVVLPTHLYGQPADLDPLLAIADLNGIKLVEDAAQAHGARYKGRRIGAHGTAVAWSFYPGKNLGAMGDAGAVTTDDHNLASRIRMLGNYGSRVKYVHDIKGMNSRLDAIQAAILSAKLPKLDEWNERRRKVAAFYTDQLAGTGVETPFVPNWAEPVWHLYVVRSKKRATLQQVLGEAGVQTLAHYPVPPHLQRAYRDLDFGEGTFPIAEQLASEVLSLPIGPHLQLDSAARVAAAIRGAGVSVRP